MPHAPAAETARFSCRWDTSKSLQLQTSCARRDAGVAIRVAALTRCAVHSLFVLFQQPVAVRLLSREEPTGGLQQTY